MVWLILPPSHRDGFEHLIDGLPPVIGRGIFTVLIVLLGWFLVFFFEVHDKGYDKYVVRWRYRYDIDFLLPTLYRPFEGRLDQRFWTEAARKPYEFTKPFYEFVGDSAEHRINENLIVRFYERITKYWTTQIIELLLIALFLIGFAYFIVYEVLDLPLTRLMILNYVVAVLFVVNRGLVRATRSQVRRATAEEIADIHRRYKDELDAAVADLHDSQGLNYRGKDPAAN